MDPVFLASRIKQIENKKTKNKPHWFMVSVSVGLHQFVITVTF